MKEEQTESVRVALYVRVSTDDQVEKYGPELQKEALLGLIKSKGTLANGKPRFVLAGDEHIYFEEGISGTMPVDERPQFSRLKENILLASEDQKPFDLVAVYKIDRFARKLKILLDIIDFFEFHGIKFISANESIDTSTPFGKAILGIIGVIAELEIETTKMRTHDGREQAAKRGVIMGSSSVYGYDKDEEKRHKILEVEAKIVEMIFDLFVNEKKSAFQISKYLSELRIPTKGASAIINKKRKGQIKQKSSIYFWKEGAIREILHDEVYIGNVYYDKGERGKTFPKEQWKLSEFKSPAIIDRLTFEKAQSIFESSKHENKQTRSKHTYLLSGLLKCDACYDDEKDITGRICWTGDRREIKKGNGKFAYSYKCNRKNPAKHEHTCTTIPLPANEIENYIMGFCKKLIQNPLATYKHQVRLNSTKIAIKQLKKREEELLNAINGFVFQKERIREQHTLGLLSTEKMQEQFSDLDTRRIKLQTQFTEVQSQISENILSENYKETLELFSAKYKKNIPSVFENRLATHELIHQLIEEIVVYSRPIENADIIAGKRKKDQKIPFRLHIKLKLPQDILTDLTERFGAGKSPLSG
ncbi:MAG: recombinase family protein [bacterium]